MKLRNKKTGQLGNFIINKDHFECVDLDYVPEYRNLAELNAEWEDYEEPKEYWYIYADGDIYKNIQDDVRKDNGCKEIGNYFETREEAEKAVEKLKAWKRLKDKGFRFNPNYSADGATIKHKDVILCRFEAYYDDCGEEDNKRVEEDLDLLFSQEGD